MHEPLQLNISAAGDDRPLTRDQKRFNTLIQQIEQSRATLKAWHDNIAAFRQAYQDVLVPMEARLQPVLLEWAFALSAAMGTGRWPRGDREAADEMITAVAADLLERDESDIRARALFERHAGVDYDTAQQESLDLMKDMAEAITGEALGELEDDITEEELLRQVAEQWRKKAQADPAARGSDAPGHRKSAAQQRREAEAQRVTQSLREVFRKLASVLHPDREPDPAQRAEKTALMARVNEAYGRQDLLALLELQLQIEQIDADHLANVDATRLKHYNKVLAEQAAELRDEIRGVEMGFRGDFGVEPSTPLDPRRLGKLLESQAANQRATLAQLRQETEMFEVSGFAKRWLQAQRRYR